jgi:ABC-type Fe3+-hydroxamate transport system substrate-binding protein
VVGRQRGSLAHLYLAGPPTYISELWSLCGGVNAFSEVTNRYFSVNTEDIITRHIDVILEFHPDWNTNSGGLEAEKKSWTQIFPRQILQQNKVYIFSQSFFIIPGPRITQIAIEFSKLIASLSKEPE